MFIKPVSLEFLLEEGRMPLHVYTIICCSWVDLKALLNIKIKNIISVIIGSG